MDIKQIHDKLVERRTLYDNAVKESQKACDEIQEILSRFSAEEIETLEQAGFGVRELLSVDLKRVKVEPSYLEQYQARLTETIEQISAYLEEELGD